MADKDKKHRLRLVVKLPRRRSLPSPTTSTKVRSSIPAAPRAASLPDEDSPQPQSSVAAAAAAGPAAAAAPPAATTTTTTAMPQKTVPSEETTAKIGNTTTIKQRLTTPPKKRKFKALLEGDGVLVAEPKKERPLNGEVVSSYAAGLSAHVQSATTPPAKKVLEGVLEKLKKKDTYGVFSEPVDSSLVPDYYEVIKEPMDFGTMCKKINKGVYVTLNLFEKDVLLICSNAMRYNAPDTVYYKQARSIQDAARKALDVVATQVGFPESVKSMPQKRLPHAAKRTWRTNAAFKAAIEPANSDYASGATLATEGEDAAWSNKAAAGHSKKAAPSDRSGSVAGDEADWVMQSLRTLKPGSSKDGRRPLSTDEYHRSTYRPRNLPAHGQGPPLAGVGGELHQLVPTGYQMEHAYAKSLSRFSVNLGVEGWNIASKRIQRVLSSGVPFGRGWVGHLEAPPGTILTPHVLTMRTAEVKATVPAVNNHRSVSTPSPSVEQSKGTNMPVWRSQAPANQYVNQASSGMGFQSSSGMGNGVSAKWTSATTEGTPTFVYSTAVQTVPSSAGMNTGLDDVSKAQARSLSLLQVEANARVNARVKLQSNVHLSQAPRPHIQPQMYTNMPSYGLHSDVGHPVAQNLVPTPTLQPLHNSEKQDHNSQKGNSAQPLHLQIGGVVNYEPSKSHSLPKSISLQQNPSSKPPPDLNLQPIDSPSTPQASGLPNSMGSAQPSLFLQL
ncbi:unnamed protein product [Sphagnum compactum]